MKQLILITALLLSTSPAFAYDPYGSESDPYSTGGSKEKTVYDQQDGSTLRGKVSTDGYIDMRDDSGNNYNGYIDRSGYSTVYDQDGNPHSVGK